VTNTENRSFSMHPNLLFDVITKQAGTLQKAVLEGVMNGVDAGATRIDITLDANQLVIVDDGKGFVDRNEIEQFFETFGTPHKEGDSQFGRFRMGRGQMMAYGTNTWRTNTFRMLVDIKGSGLDYKLQNTDDIFPGCEITVDLYKTLLPSERDAIDRDLREWLAWVSVPVFFNGRQISQDPAQAKWTFETDDAYFKLSSDAARLVVYNLGVRVMDQFTHVHGIGGVVVSKERLDVNFARNDVQSDCAVWRRIKSELRKHSAKTVTKRKLTDDQRKYLARQVVSQDIEWSEIKTVPIFTNVEGKHFSLERLRTLAHHGSQIAVAPRGDRLAIKVAQQGLALVLAEETLYRFDVTDIQQLLGTLVAFCEANNVDGARERYMAAYVANLLKSVTPIKVEEFSHLIDASYEAVDPKSLSQVRKLNLRAIQAGADMVAGVLSKRFRKVLPGHSDVAQAWTDGTKTIWIEARMLAALSEGYHGCTRIASLLLHEMLHEGPDTETHDHDIEFYERFHDAAIDTDVVGRAASAMMRQLAQSARKLGKSVSNKVLLFEDNEETIIASGGKGSPPTDVSPDQE
jgi:hypothetical protein